MIYTDYHQMYLYGLYQNQDLWLLRFGSDPFERIAKNDKIFITVIASCSLLCGLIFVWVAYLARTFKTTRHYLCRLGLYIAIVASILASWMMIF